MSRKKLIAMFESTRVLPRHEARNPRTGEPVVVPESVALPSLPPPIPDLPVYPFVTFGADEQLASILLTSPYPRPAAATDEVLLRAANKVLAALGAEPVTSLPTRPMTWKRKTTTVEFACDDEGFRFELSHA
jgi:hypothetical protein